MIILLDYQVNLPYPPIKVEGKNLTFASYLMEDYAGLASELTSITQYSFQHFTKFNKAKEFSYILEKIAVVEMHHLEILGKLINLLGATPKYLTFEDGYWTSEAVDYTTDIKTMLEKDIILEETAIKNYEKHITLIDDKYIQAILKRIILDEEKHLECFCILLNKLN